MEWPGWTSEKVAQLYAGDSAAAVSASPVSLAEWAHGLSEAILASMPAGVLREQALTSLQLAVALATFAGSTEKPSLAEVPAIS